MRYLLDTNILSELVRPDPTPAVVDWVSRAAPLDLAISVLTLGELTKGVRAMSSGRRRKSLEVWLGTELTKQFEGRLLAVDAEVATLWGHLAAASRTDGRPLPVIDGLLLATAQAHGLALVTRNAADSAGRGVITINPWEPAAG